MKKLITFITLSLLALPAFALAAGPTDVTLTTAAVISVGGYPLNVSGSSAVLQSIVVNANNFTVTLGSGSSITVSSPTFHQISADTTADVTSTVCTATASSITLSHTGSGTVTNTITPYSTICGASSSGNNSNSSNSSSSHSSSGSSVGRSTIPVTGTIPPGTPPAVIAGMTPGAMLSAVFTRNVQAGSQGQDVKALQMYLNTHGYVIASTGPGSPNNETTLFGGLTKKTLMKFQKEHGIPATGFFGPVTRAYIVQHP